MASTLFLTQPQGELWSQIQQELNENVNTRDQDLATIKDWLKKQPHLPDEWEDACLMTFLRGCKFSLEKTKKKLDMYFTMRTACPEFFTNRDINRQELMDLTTKAEGPTMPGLTPDGRRVTIYKAHDKTLDTDQIVNGFKLGMMVGDIRLREELKGVAGDIFVVDAAIVAPSHLAKISPYINAIKKFLICIQEAYPVKVKQVHIINVSPLIDIIFTMVKPFLKEKMKKRIYFHKDYTGLHEYIPKYLLPEEFGGTGSPLTEMTQAWVEKLKGYTEWFKQQESLKANEALRPGQPKNYDELFGIEGSFRQLSID